ncbi:hypothetical protein ACTFQF_00215 [Aliivibrio fischeri]|uniref:hypothetical protein n=1 Tax=Aliivibrio fischeri TaxID=668 RepID=UPI0007C4B5FA|nr:hypothetical protein [Aliivibrio fischeri]MUK37480.1 hypothetical protein [Aliivibrio fischeri]
MRATDYSKIGQALAKHDHKNKTHSYDALYAIFIELHASEGQQTQKEVNYYAMSDAYRDTARTLSLSEESLDLTPLQVAYKKHELEALNK